jgi:hypothetical protein
MPLRAGREEILAFRRRVGALDERLPPGAESLRRAAWAGLQDSMPRAALLSLHARVEGVEPSTWEDESLVHVWGPRFSTYLVAKADFALFTLARLPDDETGRRRAEEMAGRLHGELDGRRVTDREVGAALGLGNELKYATTTGTIAIRWEGARAPVIWSVPAPDIGAAEARRELARRHLHVFGPTTAERFARWAGVGQAAAAAAYAALEPELVAVRTPLGEEWLLAADEEILRSPAGAPAAARLLPSGDAYTLLDGDERTVLVERAELRERLWTPRVWPGAVLVEGEIRGTWRRAQHKVTIEPWTSLATPVRAAVEAEAASLPLPGVARAVQVVWQDAA